MHTINTFKETLDFDERDNLNRNIDRTDRSFDAKAEAYPENYSHN